jgi:hypothetical protein
MKGSKNIKIGIETNKITIAILQAQRITQIAHRYKGN